FALTHTPPPTSPPFPYRRSSDLKEPSLPEATGTGHRTTPSLLGFGLLEAVPDAEILALADPSDRNGDGISGRPNRTADGRLGRLDRKSTRLDSSHQIISYAVFCW